MSATQIDHAANTGKSSHEEQAAPNPVGLVRQCLEAFSRGDIPFCLSAIAEGCQWSGSMSPDIPYAGQFTGPEGAMKFFEAIGGNLDVKVFEFERYIGDGEHVVAIGAWSGVARKTGRTYGARLALYFQVRSGKIVCFVGHEDTALTAAALRS